MKLAESILIMANEDYDFSQFGIKKESIASIEIGEIGNRLQRNTALINDYKKSIEDLAKKHNIRGNFFEEAKNSSNGKEYDGLTKLSVGSLDLPRYTGSDESSSYTISTYIQARVDYGEDIDSPNANMEKIAKSIKSGRNNSMIRFFCEIVDKADKRSFLDAPTHDEYFDASKVSIKDLQSIMKKGMTKFTRELDKSIKDLSK